MEASYEMNRLEKLSIIIPALADMVPFVYLLFVMQRWPTVPTLIVMFCQFVSPVIGAAVIVALLVLKHQKRIPKGSDGLRVGAVLAVIGILEPVSYWI